MYCNVNCMINHFICGLTFLTRCCYVTAKAIDYRLRNFTVDYV